MSLEYTLSTYTLFVVWGQYHFLKEINTFLQQGYIKWIKRGINDIYNVTKGLNFCHDNSWSVWHGNG